MKKKLKVLIPIWLVGVTLIYLLVNMLACRWLARQLIPAEMGYLERLGSRLAHIEECERVEPMEGSHVSEFILAVNMRAAMSDFFIGADEISSEHVSYFLMVTEFFYFLINSTRRFFARPSSVLLSAIGVLEPLPTAVRRSAEMP